MASQRAPRPNAQFTEKSFYLSEFRGRTLALAIPAKALREAAAFETVLKELEANPSAVLLLSSERAALSGLLGTPVLAADIPRLEGAVWRALRASPRVGVAVGDGEGFAAACRRVALRLGVPKLVWIDEGGGLRRPDGGRVSFVDLEELAALVRAGAPLEPPRRVALLVEIEAALRAGVPAVNLCTARGLADELFTYAGSGTLFTPQRYVTVRKLGIDDFSAADDLIARGVAEGYLATRSSEEIDRVFANGYGAFVEGRHLAGIGALLPHAESGSSEIASLYTLTRFLGEGVGGHLAMALIERARERGDAFVFACTTTERVARFFEAHAFRRVPADEIPPEKWRDYDMRRRPRLRCLKRELR